MEQNMSMHNICKSVLSDSLAHPANLSLTHAAQVSLKNPSTEVCLCLLCRCADRNGMGPECIL